MDRQMLPASTTRAIYRQLVLISECQMRIAKGQEALHSVLQRNSIRFFLLCQSPGQRIQVELRYISMSANNDGLSFLCSL